VPELAANVGSIAAIARRLALALAPLRDHVGDKERFRGLMFKLGWETNDFPPAFASLATAVNAAVTKAEALGDNPPALVVADLVAAVGNAYSALTGIAVAPADVPSAAFLAEINDRLFELLLTDHLMLETPAVFNVLRVLHVIGDSDVAASPGRPSRLRVSFDLAKLRDALRAPGNLPAAVYGWGAPDFDADGLMWDLAGFFQGHGFPVRMGRRAGSDAIDPFAQILHVPFYVDTRVPARPELAIALHVLPPDASGFPGLMIQPIIPAAFGASAALGRSIGLRVRAGTASDQMVGIVLRPGGASIVSPAGAGAGVGFGFDFTPKEPTILLGSPGRTRLEWQGAALDLNASAVNGKTDVALGASLNGFALVIAGGGEGLFDGFLEKILGSGESRVTLPVGLEWGGNGIRFQGSGGFDVQVHPHLTLGPIHVDDVTVRLLVQTGGPPDISVEAAATVGGTLGPLDFFVHGIGLRAGVTLSKGNLGPLDLQIGFLPPTGVGLSVDVAGFSGGGFLILDAAKGEYAGGLELDFQGLVTVKALGVLNTKFPDGHRGFSLVLIISAEFPPVQLGFGFTLVGVGGLLGLNRTTDEDALREGIHQGALDSVLFPTNLVANGPRIVNDLRRLFPPFEDHFLIGPMVKFGWGTPTILSLEFGFLLEIPRPGFTIIGRLRIGLPFQDLPLFDIRVTFAGGVDFALGQLWFDGTLYGSRLLSFALTGDMAVRLYWKDNANFVLTAGGFHPAYTPPPMALGTLQRLGITIFDGNPRLRLETYLAITSNTVQCGAKAELYYGIEVFNVYGFIAFDVLIQFDPFHFVATLSAELAVRSGSEVLLGIRIDALLEGPTPWHAKGTGHFEISFIISVEIDVDMEVTIGESRHDTLPPVDVLPKLVEALGAATSWRAVLPSGSNLQVTLRALDPVTDGLVLHPFGSLEIREKVVPLNLDVQRVGTQRAADGHVFAVDQVSLGGVPGQLTSVREQFAPAQFVDMSDDQKLSRRSFELYDAGVQVGGGDHVNADYFVLLQVAYEVVYAPEHRKPMRFRLAGFLFDAFARHGAVSQSALSAARRAPSPLGTATVHYDAEHFAVASTDDLAVHDETLVFRSEAEARAAMGQLVDRDPALGRKIQVVPLSLTRAA
jgi:Family of unknown function (DUF6603)